MATKRRGLGRGLGQLISGTDSANSTSNNQLTEQQLNHNSDINPAIQEQLTDTNVPKRKGSGSKSSRLKIGTAKVTVQKGLPNTLQTSPTKSSGKRSGVDIVIGGKLELGSAEIIDQLVPTPGARYEEINLTDIVTNLQQPRKEFDDDELQELVASIKEFGVIQPARVRELFDSNGLSTGKYELIAGERRWRASKLAGENTLPAIIADVQDDDMLSQALSENLNRVNLNPLEVAAAYRQLIDDFGLTQEQLSTKFGKSRSVIANTLRLLNLPLNVQKRVAAGVLTEGHAKSLAGLKDAQLQEEIASRIISEGLSVRSVEELVALNREIPSRDGRDEQARHNKSPKKTGLEPLREDVANLQLTLADYLDTVVNIKLYGKDNAEIKRGQIVIDFADELDLKRLQVAIINS